MRVELSKWPGSDRRHSLTVDLDGGEADMLVVREAGEVRCEIVLGYPRNEKSLWEEVEKARRLENVPRLLSYMLRDIIKNAEQAGHWDRRDEWWRGLVAGLLQRDRPKLRPELQEKGSAVAERQAEAIGDGYRTGSALASLLERLNESIRTAVGVGASDSGP